MVILLVFALLFIIVVLYDRNKQDKKAHIEIQNDNTQFYQNLANNSELNLNYEKIKYVFTKLEIRENGFDKIKKANNKSYWFEARGIHKDSNFLIFAQLYTTKITIQHLDTMYGSNDGEVWKRKKEMKLIQEFNYNTLTEDEIFKRIFEIVDEISNKVT